MFLKELLEEMLKIGFTSYEAKIYISLLKHNPATGYEISKISGVPQAKVYENILRLTNQGAVLNLGSDPIKYVPLPPEELLKKADAEFYNTINKLKKFLPEVQKEEKLNYIWNIKGYYIIMERAARMIKDARKSITVSIWDEDALYIYNDFIEAVKRGVDLKILLYGNNKIQGINNVFYSNEGKDFKEITGSRWITVIKDDEELLAGQVSDERESVSIHTVNPALVYINKRSIIKEISSL